MRRAAPLLLLVGLTLVPGRARAQTAYSVDFGAVTAYDAATILIGFRAAPSGAERGGPDIVVFTFPDALAHGFLLLMLDLDVTYGAAVGAQVILFPRAGVSVIAGGGSSGGGAGYGYNVGFGLLGRASPTLGVRLDYTHHRFISGGETLPLSSISVGIVWFH